MKLIWSGRALRDLEAQCDFIARDSPMAAARVEDRVLAACDALPANPRSGRVGAMAGTRELAVKRTSLLVIYEIDETTVEIVHIRHMARRSRKSRFRRSGTRAANEG